MTELVGPFLEHFLQLQERLAGRRPLSSTSAVPTTSISSLSSSSTDSITDSRPGDRSVACFTAVLPVFYFVVVEEVVLFICDCMILLITSNLGSAVFVQKLELLVAAV